VAARRSGFDAFELTITRSPDATTTRVAWADQIGNRGRAFDRAFTATNAIPLTKLSATVDLLVFGTILRRPAVRDGALRTRLEHVVTVHVG
jgi:hypothetical protein